MNIKIYKNIIYKRSIILMLSKLIRLCYDGDIEKIKLILEKGNIDLNTQDKYGCTVFIAASLRGNTEAMKLLLNYSEKYNKPLDINIVSNSGNTTLIIAINRGDIDIIKLLMDFDYYKTPLNLNFKYERLKCKTSALIEAVKTCNIKILKLLLYYEKNYSEKFINIIDPYIFDMWEDTALDIARKYRYYKITELLENYIFFKDNIDKFIFSYNIFVYILIKNNYNFCIPNEMILYIRNIYKEMCWSFLY